MSQTNIPTLTQAQSSIARDTHRFRTVLAGRRFGKTCLAVEEMIACSSLVPDARVAYIAPTYQQARDIAWDMLMKRASPIIAKVNESRLELTLHNAHKGFSKIFLRGWESVDTLRGQPFNLLIADEVASMRYFWVGWNEVLRPTLTDRKGMAIFIGTPKGYNHFHELCNVSDPDWAHFHFTTYDNPHIPKEEIEDAKRQLPDDVFAQEYMADFRRQQGLVYKEFDRDRHIVDVDPEQSTVTDYIAGVDFGYTNPTAVIHIKKDVRGNYWLVDEWYKTGKTDEEIADYVWSCKFNRVYADPESPSAIASMERKHVFISEVVKNKDSITNGINKVRNLFKLGKIRVHRRCKNLIFELENYRYPDRKPDHNENELPVKEMDHLLDATRYAIMMTDEMRSLSPRDIIMIHQERNRNIKTVAR